jgi:aminoglycoside 2''-phosphotransferase
LSEHLQIANAEQALSAAFQELGGVRIVRVLGTGFRSVAVQTDDNLVFRLGRSRAAAAGYRREYSLLPKIAFHVPVRIPNSRWFVESSSQLPFGAIGYEMLPGLEWIDAPCEPSARWERVANDITSFLIALQQFPVMHALASGVSGADKFWPEVKDMRERVWPVLLNYFSREDSRRLDRWWNAFLSDPRMLKHPSVMLHGDLWYGNLLLDETRSRLAGVVDFEHLAVGDPARDLATQFHAGDWFGNLVLERYSLRQQRADELLEYRVRRYWELREFAGLEFAISQKDDAEIEDALRKLAGGPLFQPAQISH